MTQQILNFIFVITIITLVVVIVRLVLSYRALLDKYAKHVLSTEKDELKRKIRIQTNNFVTHQVDDAIEKAGLEAVELISQNAKRVAKKIRTSVAEDLIDEKQGEEKAVTAQYEISNKEIEDYKTKELAKIPEKVKQIVEEAARTSFAASFDKETQEKSIMEAIENAKHSNLF